MFTRFLYLKPTVTVYILKSKAVAEKKKKENEPVLQSNVNVSEKKNYVTPNYLVNINKN